MFVHKAYHATLCEMKSTPATKVFNTRAVINFGSGVNFFISRRLCRNGVSDVLLRFSCTGFGGPCWVSD